MTRTRKIIVITLVAFALYALFNEPEEAADTVGNLWDLLVQGLESIGDFFDSLLDR